MDWNDNEEILSDQIYNKKKITEQNKVNNLI